MKAPATLGNPVALKFSKWESCQTTESLLQSRASSRFEGKKERRLITFRIALEDFECLGLSSSIFLLCGLILGSLLPRVRSDPTSTRPLTELRTRLLASEGTSSDFKRDAVSLSSLTVENDTSSGVVRTEGTEGDFNVGSPL